MSLYTIADLHLSIGVGKEKAMEILESDGEIAFNKYHHSEKWHFEKRLAINNAIKALTNN